VKIYKKKNILVTGSSGFVGTNLIKRLVKYNANVIGVINRKSPQIKLKNVKYIKADLTKKSNCLKVTKNIDYIFMCSANSSGANVMEKKPLTHLTPNIIMNSLMLEAAYFNKVSKFCFISSNTVYPLTKYPVSEANVNYNFFPKYHIVGWMKIFSEQMCKMYNYKIKHPMQTLIVRPGNLYGPYDKYTKNESKVVAALIRRFVEKQDPLIVWGDGKDLKDFIYIDDFIEGLLRVFSIKNFSGPINLASGKSETIRKIIGYLKIITKQKNVKIIYKKDMPSMIPYRIISIKKAKKLFKFNPKTSLFKGLKETYIWYKKFYKNRSPENLK